ncbi:MAG: translation initiation factor IF-1 [Patescibacteria group bacterium]|nr:translation initiation factor IF-1 [Patescibacteria group bacterium]
MKDQKNRVDGVVVEALPDTIFRVKLADERVILAYLSGKMRMHRIRVIQGDTVVVEISSYDKERGRIVYRGKSN